MLFIKNRHSILNNITTYNNKKLSTIIYNAISKKLQECFKKISILKWSL